MSDTTAEMPDTSTLPARFRPSPTNAPPVLVRLLTGHEYTVTIDENFDAFAAEAIDALRNRKQWRSVSAARAKMTEACREYLKYLKLDADEQLNTIASAGVIEVEIPLASGEAAFAFPWEFALSEATASLRKSTPLLVIRWLSGGQAGTGPGTGVGTALVVQSSPANLSEFYTFDSEQKLVASSLPNVGMQDAIGLTEAQLKSQIEVTSPNLIHFAGIDGLQGAALLKWPETRTTPGMFFPDDHGMALIVPPETMAEAATAGKKAKPALVSYNLYNSSWPLASNTVAKGTAAAIGFQDEIDDSAAELFFARFYEAWQSSGWNILAACRDAWQGLQASNTKLTGTGVVLWSAHSLIKAPTTGTAAATSPSPETIHHTPAFPDLRKAISVTINPRDKLNYSMLHNNRPLFEKFEVKRQTSGRLLNVRVDITLQAGTESADYSAVFDLGRSTPLVDVNERARVSLTSDMARSLRESVYTSLFVSVKWEHELVYQETFRVALLPPDEWRDDDLNRVWLPSFVLPRDPAIAKLIDGAQKFLTALADDAGAGFDGYQGVRLDAKIEDRCESVDRQVYSLWWSLIQDYGLSYINPPPSFTAKCLRTPADIIGGRRGTCIDLTLLLAALLEYIDIHPVIFLLQGHAFPGYWRSEESYALLAQGTLSRPQTSGPGSQYAWMFDRVCYSDLLQLVREGHLIPLESIALTQRCGYWDAVAQGIENLRNKNEFEFLIDIKRAREANVTPIPLWSIHT
jgi:hypothetical protein